MNWTTLRSILNSFITAVRASLLPRPLLLIVELVSLMELCCSDPEHSIAARSPDVNVLPTTRRMVVESMQQLVKKRPRSQIALPTVMAKDGIVDL